MKRSDFCILLLLCTATLIWASLLLLALVMLLAALTMLSTKGGGLRLCVPEVRVERAEVLDAVRP